MEIIKMEKLEENLFLLTFPISEKDNLINNYNINENIFEYGNNIITIRVDNIDSFLKEKKNFKIKNLFSKKTTPGEVITSPHNTQNKEVVEETKNNENDGINYKLKYKEYLQNVIDKDIQDKFELDQWEDIQSLLGDISHKYINKDLLRDLTSQNLKVDYYSEEHIQILQSIYSKRNGKIESWEKMIILHPAYNNKNFNFLNIIMKILDCKELTKEEKQSALLENPFFFKTLSDKAKKISNNNQEEVKENNEVIEEVEKSTEEDLPGDFDSYHDLGEEEFI